MSKPIAFLMGSDSDLPQLESAFKLLGDLEIGFHVRVLSAHRTPVQACEFAAKAKEQGVQVLIGVAGMAAHLAGALASHSELPVLGVPADSGPMHGEDAMWSTAMMPPGIPVGTLGIGKAGAINAALLAARIIALSDEGVAERLRGYREADKKKTLAKDAAVRERFGC